MKSLSRELATLLPKDDANKDHIVAKNKTRKFEEQWQHFIENLWVEQKHRSFFHDGKKFGGEKMLEFKDVFRVLSES